MKSLGSTRIAIRSTVKAHARLQKIFQYFVDNAYAPDQEDGIAWNDSEINIDWQKIFDEYDIKEPMLSEKDQHRHTLTEYERGQNS